MGGGNDMRRTLTASVEREGAWDAAQCLEADVASQGETGEDALANLWEALELHLQVPATNVVPNA